MQLLEKVKEKFSKKNEKSNISLKPTDFVGLNSSLDNSYNNDIYNLNKLEQEEQKKDSLMNRYFELNISSKWVINYLNNKEKKRLELEEDKRRFSEYKTVYISRKDLKIPWLKWYSKLVGINDLDRLYMIEMVVEYMNAWLEMAEAFEMLSYKAKKRKLQAYYYYIKTKLGKWVGLDVILEEFPSLVKSHQLYLLKIWVETWNLKQALLSLKEDIQQSVSNRKKINSIVLYPKIVIWFSFTILFGFIIFWLPKIAEFVWWYEKLPPIAQFSYKIYLLMTNWWFIIIPSIVWIVILHKMTLAKSLWWIKNMHQLTIDMPIFWILYRMVNVKVVFFYFYLLERAGKNIDDSLGLVKKSLQNYSYFCYIDEIEGVSKKNSLNIYQSLIELSKKKFGPWIKKTDNVYILPDKSLFDDRILTYIQTGIKTGTLGRQFERIYRRKAEDIDFFIANMKTYVELGSLIIVAPVVLYIMMVVYLSLFSIYNSVG